MKKNLSKILCVLLAILFIFAGCTSTQIPEEPTEFTTQTEETTVVITKEVQEMAEETIEAIENGEDIETETIAKPQDTVETELEVEEFLEEPDGTVEYENLSYDGDNTGKGKDLLGAPIRNIYYSQIDNRWKNVMYSSKNDKSQTIGTSGCGPTSAAMVVTMSKGAILPTTMAKLFKDNGYRTRDNGTAWSVWPFVADYFDFEDYGTTCSYDTMIKKLKTGKYLVIVSCAPGLFTTSGHYIVIDSYKNGYLRIKDPQVYKGKFNLASRRAANVKFDGTTVLVTEANFKKYANPKQFWFYSIDTKKKEPKPSTTKKVESTTKKTNNKFVSYVRYVKVDTQLNIREKANDKAAIVGKLKNGDKVTIIGVSGSWSKIGTNKWVATKYLVKNNPIKKVEPKINYKTKVGNKYRLKADATLNTQGNFKGTNCHYYALTQCEVLKHYSATVDKVKIVKTGKIRYVKVKDFKY